MNSNIYIYIYIMDGGNMVEISMQSKDVVKC